MLKCRKWVAIAAIAGAGIIASISAFTLMHKYDEYETSADFENEARELKRSVEQNIALACNTLDSLKACLPQRMGSAGHNFMSSFNTTQRVENAVQALEWIPRVPDSKRAEYELAGRRSGFRTSEFIERSPAGKLVRAAKRAEYYPVFYVEPMGHEAALGFDLISDHIRSAALKMARDTGLPCRHQTDSPGAGQMPSVWHTDLIGPTAEDCRTATLGSDAKTWRALCWACFGSAI